MNRVHQLYCRSGRWRSRLDELLPWALDGLDLSTSSVLELGSGPGRTTDWLAPRCGRLATVEYDAAAAELLAARRPDVDVQHGDATSLTFPERSFDAVVCFTMLHHIPSRDLQGRLFAEALRVLRPGGVFAGSDSRWGPLFAIAHLGDVMVLVEPQHLSEQLTKTGFATPTVSTRRDAVRFQARRPAAST